MESGRAPPRRIARRTGRRRRGPRLHPGHVLPRLRHARRRRPSHGRSGEGLPRRGSDGLPEPGGQSGGCGIPLGPATSVMINLVVVNAGGPGNLRAWAVADPQPPAPNAAVLNYGVVAGLAALANGIAVPICNAAT